MKTKGITIWEQHVERFVLGIAVLVFVGLTALQFIGDPNATDIAGAGSVSPGEVDDLVKDEADRLRDGLTPEAAPPVPAPDDPQLLLETFEHLRSASINPESKLTPYQYQLVLGGEDAAVPEGVPFVVPALPAPYKVASDQYFDAVAEQAQSIVDEHEALQSAFVPLPHDLTWVTAFAQFDVGEVRRQYESEGPDGARPIPPSWYDGRVDVLDVRVEREELMDGQWVNRTLMEPIPGQFNLRTQLAGKVDAALRDYVGKQFGERTVRDAVERPEFYPTVNEWWIPPGIDDGLEEELVAGESEEVRDLRRRIRKYAGDLDRLRKRLEDAGGELEPESGPPSSTSGGAPSGGRGGGGSGSAPGGGLGATGAGGSGGMGRGGGGGGTDDEATKRLRIKLTQQVRRLEKRLAGLEEQLRALVGVVEVVEEETDEPEETIMIWAHDLTVEPGTQYRYRFTVDVFNPFFARRLNLIEEQHPLADAFTVRSPESEWSPGHLVDPFLRVFVTDAAPAGQAALAGGPDLGAATAEVFRFHHARWWRERFRVAPGDRIGEIEQIGPRGATIDVDFRTGWFLLDVVDTLASAGRARDGATARVLLQGIDDDRAVWRSPNDDATDLDRELLGDKVDEAELTQTASLSTP